jgi:hypothetical protein
LRAWAYCERFQEPAVGGVVRAFLLSLVGLPPGEARLRRPFVMALGGF